MRRQVLVSVFAVGASLAAWSGTASAHDYGYGCCGDYGYHTYYPRRGSTAPQTNDRYNNSHRDSYYAPGAPVYGYYACCEIPTATCGGRAAIIAPTISPTTIATAIIIAPTMATGDGTGTITTIEISPLRVPSEAADGLMRRDAWNTKRPIFLFQRRVAFPRNPLRRLAICTVANKQASVVIMPLPTDNAWGGRYGRDKVG